MTKLSDDILHFIRSRGYVIVSTIDSYGRPHSSCKDVLDINEKGEAYLFDLYQAETHKNLKRHPMISITAVSEHKFRGYCLKGEAKLITKDQIDPAHLKQWDNKIASRLTQRVLRNMKGEKGHPKHPEALLPDPEYLILMHVKEVVDLTPKHLTRNL